jgi:hypothetical protein
MGPGSNPQSFSISKAAPVHKILKIKRLLSARKFKITKAKGRLPW